MCQFLTGSIDKTRNLNHGVSTLNTHLFCTPLTKILSIVPCIKIIHHEVISGHQVLLFIVLSKRLVDYFFRFIIYSNEITVNITFSRIIVFYDIEFAFQKYSRNKILSCESILDYSLSSFSK